MIFGITGVKNKRQKKMLNHRFENPQKPKTEPENKEPEKFDLDLPAINNYVNLILQDMRDYQFLSSHRYEPGSRFHNAILALVRLLNDLPPKGQSFMVQQIPGLKGFDAEAYYHATAKDDKEAGELYDQGFRYDCTTPHGLMMFIKKKK
jgi:hypothetical protein